MSDKEFDEFFKKMAENYDIPYNAKAWHRMRAKLDKAEGVGGGNIRKIITGLALLILLGASTLLYFGNSQTTSPVKVSETKDKPLPAETGEREGTEERTSQNQTADAANADPSQTPSAAFSEQKAGQDRISSEEDGAIAWKVTPPPSEEEKRVNQTALQRSVPLTMSEQPASEEIYYTYSNVLYLPSQLWAPLPVAWTPPLMDLEEITTHKEEPQLIESPERNKKEDSILPGRSPFYRAGLSFSVSPDFSAIGLTHISQVGTKSGIGLEFFIFRNLSLNTGVILSRKIYSATDGYEPPAGYWKYYTKPNRIDAECNVLDIPINLRYYIFNWKKSRIYLSSGLSSYLMLKEDYQYQYDGYVSDKYRSHSARNKNHHYFKVSNFSAGYEKALGERWALQAEPFVKIPLAGVGEGKVKLSTAGMFIILNYRLGLSGSDKE